MSSIDPQIFPIDQLLSRIQGYLDDVEYKANKHEDVGPMFNFRSLALIAEIYEFARLYFHNRKENLSDYYGMSLKKCLNTVIEIEKIQESLDDLYYNICRIKEDYPDESTEDFSNGGHNCRTETELQLQKLYTEGIASLSEYICGEKIPTAADSVLWLGEKDYKNTKFQYAKIFHNAHEKLDEGKSLIELSRDPDDAAYNERIPIMKNIGNHIAYKAKMECTNSNGFNALGYILDSYHRADSITTDDICKEFGKSLEMLRVVFMTDAEDIYYIRTGDYAKLRTNGNSKKLQEIYTVLPFTQYKEARLQYEEDYIETELRWKEEDWRTDRNYVGKKLSVQQRLEFFSDTRNKVEEEMQKFPELWTVRMHSGGLDAVITPENFAMMFYRREGKYFVELQWQHEILSEKLRLLEEEQRSEGGSSKESIVDKSIREFIDNITIMCGQLYEKWNDKTVTPGAHKAEARITIKYEELVQYLDEVRENNYDTLKAICYPKDSKYNRKFCRFVAELRTKGYFGKLPDNHIADTLGPIIGISAGTAANYLAEK